jgi:hypothetical protein
MSTIKKQLNYWWKSEQGMGLPTSSDCDCSSSYTQLLDHQIC